jgi:hypothetical protein
MFGVFGPAQEGEAHLICALLTPGDPLCRPVGIARVALRIIEDGRHVDPGAFGQFDRLTVVVADLPVEIPILEPNQFDLLFIRRSGPDVPLFADLMHVWKDIIERNVIGKRGITGNADVRIARFQRQI